VRSQANGATLVAIRNGSADSAVRGVRRRRDDGSGAGVGAENTNLNRLEIVAAVANPRSQRVAEKVGAQRDAVLRKRTLAAGIPSDALLYSIIRPD